MTTSTLNFAVRTADSAVDREHAVLETIRRDEQTIRTILDQVHQEIERLRHREQELSAQLAAKGRETEAQEQRIALIHQRLTAQTELLLRVMGELGLEPLQPGDHPSQTQPDELGLGDVPATEPPAAYIQQATELGAPVGMTQPVPAVVFTGDPAEPQQNPPGNLGELTTDSPSGAHQVVRTGAQSKGRGGR